ncbi:hypothetical protein niasHS_001251 [Heterodera schachtii]|uniref:Uncharacterized protein n=1 Tax=Heterodera schachtii TaxID=97005 RepID=A0ABD2KHW2_HETSC
MSKNARILYKCAKACVNKKQFPRMVFENKDECNKVKEWASQLESGDAQSKENALMNLRNTKEQLLLEQNANESVGATTDKNVANSRSISHKKGGLFGCFGGQNGNDGHYHHGTVGSDRSRERDQHNAALYGTAIVGYGIVGAGCGGAGCGGGCGAR